VPTHPPNIRAPIAHASAPPSAMPWLPVISMRIATEHPALCPALATDDCHHPTPIDRATCHCCSRPAIDIRSALCRRSRPAPRRSRFDRLTPPSPCGLWNRDRKDKHAARPPCYRQLKASGRVNSRIKTPAHLRSGARQGSRRHPATSDIGTADLPMRTRDPIAITRSHGDSYVIGIPRQPIRHCGCEYRALY
jgi:hypothetical protein